MSNNRKRTWYRQGSELTEEIADTKVMEGALFTGYGERGLCFVYPWTQGSSGSGDTDPDCLC